LISECKKIDLEFSILLTKAAILTTYDIAYRYPGISPDFEPSVDEAEHAVKDAQSILDFVKRKIGI
jgi:HEPN domain-containing protein